jgi:hypothetical protein
MEALRQAAASQEALDRGAERIDVSGVLEEALGGQLAAGLRQDLRQVDQALGTKGSLFWRGGCIANAWEDL